MTGCDRRAHADGFHNTEQYANNRVGMRPLSTQGVDRPMRGLKRDHTARVIIRGRALMQNIRRGHYELGIDAHAHRRIECAFTQLAQTIQTSNRTGIRFTVADPSQRNSAAWGR